MATQSCILEAWDTGPITSLSQRHDTLEHEADHAVEVVVIKLRVVQLVVVLVHRLATLLYGTGRRPSGGGRGRPLPPLRVAGRSAQQLLQLPPRFAQPLVVLIRRRAALPAAGALGLVTPNAWTD